MSASTMDPCDEVPVETGTFYHYLCHSRGAMPEILAPDDSPSEEQFTLGNVATELELEPRRASVLGTFDDAPTGPTTRPTDRKSPSTRPTALPREKGVRFYCFVSKRGPAILVEATKGSLPGGRGGLKFGRRR